MNLTGVEVPDDGVLAVSCLLPPRVRIRHAILLQPEEFPRPSSVQLLALVQENGHNSRVP